jgi:type IV pilus assembly protein PilX
MKRVNASPTSSRQRGVALAVVLILLLVVTLIGVASLRGVVLEERMAANQYDRSLAFQAAEAALRLGEKHVADHVPTPADGAACDAGVCPKPIEGDPPRWEAEDAWQSVEMEALGPLAGEAPQYIIEYLGDTFPCDPNDPAGTANECKRYRITARSQPGGEDRASVVLQSIYATDE